MRAETVIALALGLLAFLLLTGTEIDRAWLVDRIDDVNRLGD
jgi:hypothetical protein